MYQRIEESVMPGSRLGRHLNHDPRSRQYRFKAAPTVTLADVEHTIHIPILDQGNIGSCVANTGTEIMASDVFWSTLTPAEQGALNESWAVRLYHDLTVADGYPGTYPPDDTGSDGLTLAKVLTSRKLISGYQHIFDVTSALAALQKSALAIGMKWLTGCDRPNSDGIVTYTGTERGGHEITAYKYIASEQLVGLRNHWSSSWGAAGTFYMTVADFGKALANDGDATVLVPRTSPAPTPSPVVSADAALTSWWDISKDWSTAKHTASNARAAKAAQTLAKAKGLI